MASIDFNPLRERFGRVVLRQRGDRVFFARAPRRDGTPSAARARHNLVFSEAAVYSKAINNHPVRREPYAIAAQANGAQVFPTIMKDFLTKPLIRRVDLSGYHGQVGNPIVVEVRDDDINIGEVGVSLRRAVDDTLVEEAGATPDGVWRYLATQVVPVGTVLRLTLTVRDSDNLELKRVVPLVVA